jgi:hypothetical protein
MKQIRRTGWKSKAHETDRKDWLGRAITRHSFRKKNNAGIVLKRIIAVQKAASK